MLLYEDTCSCNKYIFGKQFSFAHGNFTGKLCNPEKTGI